MDTRQQFENQNQQLERDAISPDVDKRPNNHYMARAEFHELSAWYSREAYLHPRSVRLAISFRITELALELRFDTERN